MVVQAKFTLFSPLCLPTAAVLSSRPVEVHSSSGTVPAFLLHLWPARQPAVVWMTLLSPSTAQQCEMAGNGTGDWERGAILNTGTCMLSRYRQHSCVLHQHTHIYLWSKGLACYFIHCCCHVKMSPQNVSDVHVFVLNHIHTEPAKFQNKLCVKTACVCGFR